MYYCGGCLSYLYAEHGLCENIEYKSPKSHVVEGKKIEQRQNFALRPTIDNACRDELVQLVKHRALHLLSAVLLV